MAKALSYKKSTTVTVKLAIRQSFLGSISQNRSDRLPIMSR